MNISFDTVITILTLLSSAIALFFSTRKLDKESKNIDADTISKLYDTIGEQEKRYNSLKQETVVEQEKRYDKLKFQSDRQYQELKKEFEDYKKAMNTQFALLVNENARLRAWAHKLCKQLEKAQIVPEKFE